MSKYHVSLVAELKSSGVLCAIEAAHIIESYELLPDKIAEQAAEIDRLNIINGRLFNKINRIVSELDETILERNILRAGLEAIRDSEYQGYPETKGQSCPHGLYAWETCIACIDSHIGSVLDYWKQ